MLHMLLSTKNGDLFIIILFALAFVVLLIAGIKLTKWLYKYLTKD
jgi:hypothetical protein